MVTLHDVEEQLKKIGCNFKFFGRPEIKELTNILMNDEIIAGCSNGRYEGGFALLCVTNHRLLLIDRRPLFLTLEDVRFDMISEIDFAARLVDSTVYISTPNRKLRFTSWNHHRLRNILNYTQQRVMEVRQHYMLQQFQPNPTYSAPVVGSLAMQGNATNTTPQPYTLPMNPYTKVPVLMRRRRYPKFY